MKSEWKVTCNIIEGRRLYGIYRLLDVNEADHSGNREFRGGYSWYREAAEVCAQQLNEEEKGREKGREK